MSVTILCQNEKAESLIPNISGWEFNGHIHALGGAPFYCEFPLLDSTGKIHRESPRPPDDATKEQALRWADIIRHYYEMPYGQHRLKLLKERSQGLIEKDMDVLRYIEEYCVWLEMCGGYHLAG